MSGLPEGFPEPYCWSGVGKGWWPIIAELHEQLLKLDPDYTVAQVKEKFGTLRYYFDSERLDNYREMELLVDAAEAKSHEVCETCGQPGELRSSTGWYLTLCAEHEAELLARRASGQWPG